MKSISAIINESISSNWSWGEGFMTGSKNINLKNEPKYLIIHMKASGNDILFGSDYTLKQIDTYHNQEGKLIDAVNKLKVNQSYSFDKTSSRGDEYTTTVIKLK